MSWTTSGGLRAQVQRLWDKGRLLSCLLEAEPLFPLRLTLKGPSSPELSGRFDEVRAWIVDLQGGAKKASTPGYRLVLCEIRHRVIGVNAIPSEVWIDTLDDVLALIDKRRQGERFKALIAMTGNKSFEARLPWVKKRPLRALELADDWTRLLHVVIWLRNHPRPGIYLRQLDLPGIHSKFIEGHRGVLSELLDLALPPEAIEASAREPLIKSCCAISTPSGTLGTGSGRDLVTR